MQPPSTYSHIKFPGVQINGTYSGRFKDRNPEIRAAGKLTATSDSASLCMRPTRRPDSPDVIRKFRAFVRPDAGKIRVFYGKAHDPHLRLAKEMTHGLSTQPSIAAGQLLNPQPKSHFLQKRMDTKESIYASLQRAPLGRSHDQHRGLPEHLNPSKYTFGIQTKKDGSAGELINPNKSPGQVFAEEEEGRDLYRKTHFDYRVGEQCDRNYFHPRF